MAQLASVCLISSLDVYWSRHLIWINNVWVCTGNTSRPHRQATSWHWKYCLTDNVIHEKRVRKSQWPPTALVAVHHHAEGAIFNHCFYVGQFWRIQLICNNKNAHFTLAVGTHNLVKILIENSAKSIHQIQICLKIDLPIQEAFKGILTFLSSIRCILWLTNWNLANLFNWRVVLPVAILHVRSIK